MAAEDIAAADEDVAADDLVTAAAEEDVAAADDAESAAAEVDVAANNLVASGEDVAADDLLAADDEDVIAMQKAGPADYSVQATVRSLLALLWATFPFTCLASVIFLLSSAILQALACYTEDTCKLYLQTFPATIQSLFMVTTGAVDWVSMAQDDHLPVSACVTAETGCNFTFQFSGEAPKSWLP